MDYDLLYEMFAFLPHKYFVMRALYPKMESPISFVDYERKFYCLVKGYKRRFPSDDYEWRRYGYSGCNQEYGPAAFAEGRIKWKLNGRIHRETGPAIILTSRPKVQHDEMGAPEDLCDLSYNYIPEHCGIELQPDIIYIPNFIIPVNKGELITRLHKIWVKNDTVLRIELFPSR